MGCDSCQTRSGLQQVDQVSPQFATHRDYIMNYMHWLLVSVVLNPCVPEFIFIQLKEFSGLSKALLPWLAPYHTLVGGRGGMIMVHTGTIVALQNTFNMTS